MSLQKFWFLLCLLCSTAVFVAEHVAAGTSNSVDVGISSHDVLRQSSQDNLNTTRISVPFNSSLVGQEFRFFIRGNRFPFFARVEINETVIAYFPSYQQRTVYGGVIRDCYPSLQLLLNPDVNQLKIIHYLGRSPRCTCGPVGFGSPPMECNRSTEESVPIGPTREAFEHNIRVMFQGISVIRERHGRECYLRSECAPYIPRPELDGILTYMYGIGYALGFFVDNLDVTMYTIGH